MWRRVGPLMLWTSEVLAAIGCTALIATTTTTVHLRDDLRLLAVASVAVAVAVTAMTAIARLAAPGTSVLACAIAVVGATRAVDARVAVTAFAIAACVPIAALAVSGRRASGPLVAALITSALTVLVRLVWRDPFRELQCEPFCDTNLFLQGHHPDLVRAAELLLAVATVVAVVHVALRREVRGTAVSAALALAALYALRLVWRPRTVPDSAADLAIDAGLLLGLLVIALGRGADAWTAIAERREMRAFGRALATAQDVTGIETSLRRSTRDGELEVHLASEPHVVAESRRRTEVVRDGRTVATIVHQPDKRDRVARAITPSVALALETQLLLSHARARVAEVDATRALAAQSTDAARRALERNLHDGAQQHMLVAGMTLAAAADGASGGEGRAYRAAATDVGTALVELRRIGRGDGATVAELGLADAATSLAGRSSVWLTATVHGCGTQRHDCWPLDTATAAYRLLVSTVSEAETGGAAMVQYEARCLGPDAGRHVTCRHDGTPGERALVEDRVLAAGGRLSSDTGGDEQTIEAWLP